MLGEGKRAGRGRLKVYKILDSTMDALSYRHTVDPIIGLTNEECT